MDKQMPPAWTGEIIKQMHLSRISRRDLAAVLDVAPEYVTMVLNGKRQPKDAQAQFEAALEKILDNKK